MVQAKPRGVRYGNMWPPHDTEESVLGTDRHQTTITNLRWGVNEAAHVGLPDGHPVPWQALSQIALLGCLRADGSPFRVYPDIFVYPRPIDPGRGSLTIHVDGPPVLLVEVLSEAIYEVGLDLEHGKGYSYARAGIAEYLTIDHTRRFLPEGIRAWRLVDGVYQPWLPDGDTRDSGSGRWQSQQIPIAIGLEDDWATVYRRDGDRILREGQVEAEHARLRAEVERLRRLLGEHQG
jgi:hypothetical protein